MGKFFRRNTDQGSILGCAARIAPPRESFQLLSVVGRYRACDQSTFNMPIFGDKQETSITVKVNQLTKPPKHGDLDDDASFDTLAQSLPSLLELVRAQPHAGAIEVARAVRKRIKYGALPIEQVRALTLLELVVLNGGLSIGPVLARDDKLIEVLKGLIAATGRAGSGQPFDGTVRAKAQAISAGWKYELAELDEYKYLAGLYKYIPKLRRRALTSQSNAGSSNTTPRQLATPKQGYVSPDSPGLRSDSDSGSVDAYPPSRPTVSSPYSTTPRREEKKTKKSRSKKSKSRKSRPINTHPDTLYKIGQINYKVEAPKIRQLIAKCHTSSTSLSNALVSLPSGMLPLDNANARKAFDDCKKGRSKVLAYLQYVGAGSDANKKQETLDMDAEFLGSLIGANEQLILVFTEFDKRCGYQSTETPTYGENELDSGDSYYTSSEEEEAAAPEPVVIPARAPPPPPKRAPPKPKSKPQLASPVLQPAPVLHSTDDPFGDCQEVAHPLYG